MAPHSILHTIDKEQPVDDELTPELMEQLIEILEQSEPAESTEERDNTYWNYSIPAAGVRYYGF